MRLKSEYTLLLIFGFLFVCLLACLFETVSSRASFGVGGSTGKDLQLYRSQSREEKLSPMVCLK